MVAWIALGISLVTLALSAFEFRDNRKRLHRDLAPQVTWRWGGTPDRPLLVLTLLQETTSHRDEVASVWLATGYFVDDAGERLSDTWALDHPWPQGWEWTLPAIRIIPEPKQGDTFPVVVGFRVKGWKPWQATPQVEAPPPPPYVFAY